MRRLALHCIGICASLLLLSSTAQMLDPTPSQAIGCYKIRAEARRGEMGYKHYVVVDNQCEYWLQCDVWTNVDPQPSKTVTVGPKASEEVQTNGSSEQSSVKGFGSCHRK